MWSSRAWSFRVAIHTLQGMTTALSAATAPTDPLLAVPRLESGIDAPEVGRRGYASWALGHLDAVLADGRDHYGPAPTPMLVSILDVRDRACPRDPLPLDQVFRVQRRGRRNPAGVNLNADHGLLRALQAASSMTGEARYGEAAHAHAGWCLRHLVDERGFWWWGWHRHFDVFTRRMDGHEGNVHEIHAIEDHHWDLLWALDPESVRREIDGLWRWHVIDQASGEINRHGDGQRGCDFAMTAGAIIRAFSFRARVDGEEPWRARARLVSDWFWRHRDPLTGLMPERPNAGRGRFDGGCCPTSVPGLHGRGLLQAYAADGDVLLRDRALTLLADWDRHGWDHDAGAPWGALRLDGTPVRWDGRSGDATDDLCRTDYSRFEPYDHAEPWQPYAAGYEHPLSTAQTYAYAHALTGDLRMLQAARRWAAWIRSRLPVGPCLRPSPWYRPYAAAWAPHGGYAQHYGRAIALFLQLWSQTREDSYLADARAVADDAVSRLWYRGLLRSHPCKPYAEAIDGIGTLLHALLALDRAVASPAACLTARGAVLSDGSVLGFDAW